MTKTVLITGASSGLGAEFVKQFITDGYHVILTARNQQQMEAVVADFPSELYTIITQDLAVEHGAVFLYEKIKLLGLDVDILINNAGFGLLGEFLALDLTQQLQMMHLNMLALIELTYLCLGEMNERKSGKILNVASIAAYLPGPKMAIYYATKAFVLSFSQALAEEMAENGIQVSVLNPGPTATNFANVAQIKEAKMFAHPMTAQKVVTLAYKQFHQGKKVIIPGFSNKLLIGITKVIPHSVLAKGVKLVTR